MFKKMMTGLEKGSANVNLHLNNTYCQAGDEVQGEIIVSGGEVEQSIQGVTVHFFIETPEYIKQIVSISATSSFYLSAKEERTIPFSYALPENAPLSSPHVRFHFSAVLDIQNGVDCTDKKPIDITPCTEVVRFYQALEQIGFQQTFSSGKIGESGQVFVFEPFDVYTGRVNEMEFYISYNDDGILLTIVLDVPSLFDEREVKDVLFLPMDTLQDINELAFFINNWLENRLSC